MIDSCTLCGLCGTLCPNDLSMGEVCLEARRDMVDSGHMPASHHEFALRDMAHSRSEAAAFARSQPGFEKSAVAFFPGCQLAASSPWHVERVYAHLAERLPGGVGLIVDCCGAPALWSGRRALHDEVTATPARDLAKPRRAGDRHRLLDLSEDARRIPARNEGALAVDGDRRDRLAGRGKAARRRPVRPSRSLHGPARVRRATRRARARERPRRRGPRARRRRADDLLRLRGAGVLRQSRGDGQDRQPAHRRGRGRLPDLLRDVPRQFRAPRQALNPSARSYIRFARRRRSGRAARSRAFRAGATTGSGSRRAC